MQIHYALSERPDWQGDERLGQTAIVHVTPGLDGVSRAVNEAERGLLPAEATIVVGQPMTMDATRAPDGSWILWIQLQELPGGRVKGDAAGELDVGDGTWTEELKERYADRIHARLARHIPNLDVGDAAARRLVAGRHGGGERQLRRRRHLRRLVRARPEPRSGGRGRRCPATGRPSRGSGTSARARIPGPGLGAGSGYLVAKELLRAAARAAARPAGSRSSAAAREDSRSARSRPPRATFAEDLAAYRAAGCRGDRDLGVQARATTRPTSRRCARPG